MRSLAAVSMLALASALALVSPLACTSESSSGPERTAPDASSSASGADAAPGGINALGQSCTGPDECPSSPPHRCVYLQSGNPNLGYCSPECGGDQDCAAGYTGPATGTPTCFVPDQPRVCSILCGDTEDCPDDLVCIVTGGPVNVCATPM